MTGSRGTSHVVRGLLGLAVSAAFIIATLTRVDFDLLTEAWARVSIATIGIAILISFAEVGVRGQRWAILLRPFTDATYGNALAYLSIGHLANAVLPARLGDVTRAFLAGGRLHVSRLTVLGTIAVERVADAGLLAVAVAVGVAIGYSDLAPALVIATAVGLASLVVLVLVAVALRRETVVRTRIGALVAHYATRFAAGAAALRRPAAFGQVAALTVLSFVLAVGIMHASTTAVGLSLAFWQSALIVAAVTLSTAIPAGPASLGTYEFVGVTVMSSMGLAPEPSLLAVALVHVIATVVPASMGLAAMWSMGMRRLLPKAATQAP